MSTPVCPACKVKFAHDGAKSLCKNCGIPDEVISMGPDMIARWQKLNLRKEGRSKRETKEAFYGKRTRRRNKHGRKGVRRDHGQKRHAGGASVAERSDSERSQSLDVPRSV